MEELHYKHFKFADGTIVTYSYIVGDQESLAALSDLAVQLKHFPDKEQVGETEHFVNQLVEVYETVDASPTPPQPQNPIDNIQPVSIQNAAENVGS